MNKQRYHHYDLLKTFRSKKFSANPEDTTYTLGGEGEVFQGEPDIPWRSIVFIKNAGWICTHGRIYKGEGGSSTGGGDISKEDLDQIMNDYLGSKEFEEKIQEVVNNLDLENQVVNSEGFREKLQDQIKDLDVSDQIGDSVTDYIEKNEGIRQLIQSSVSDNLEGMDIEEIIRGIDFSDSIKGVVDEWFQEESNKEAILDLCKPIIEESVTTKVDELREELKEWCNDLERVTANALIRHEQWIQEHS